MTSVLSVASSSASSSGSNYSTALATNYVPPSPASIHSNRSPMSSSSSLSNRSLEGDDEENVTITNGRLGGQPPSPKSLGKQKSRSQEDLRILAISTHITELSYAISDIQTRIFEIQELRHKSQAQNGSGEPSSPSNTANNLTSTIDQSLMALDERLESVEKGVKSVNENIQPYLPSTTATPVTATQSSVNAVTPTTTNIAGVRSHGANENTSALLRKHATLIQEWESVQDESDVLREELKEDKWLTVFRTVTDQADGMMSSLEKAVNRCQDFIFQVHQQKRNGHNGADDLFGSTNVKGTGPVTLETFTTLLESYEAKKKHYMPATSKVLSIIDRGVRDRVTKNGETLRRHSESAQRWKTLRDRIGRTDAEMENVRKILIAVDSGESEASSSNSGHPSYLGTPPSGSRATLGGGSEKGSEKGTLSRSMSPLRKFARRITGSTSGGKPHISGPTLVTPLSVKKKVKGPYSEPRPPPSSATSSNFSTFTPSGRKQRASLFPGVKNTPEPVTPERPGHKHSQSVTPEPSPRIFKPDDSSGGNMKSYAGTPSTSTFGKSRTSLAPSSMPPSLVGRPSWNSSTKVDSSDEKRNGTVRGTPSRPPSRPPSSTGMYKSTNGDLPPVPAIGNGTPYRRSLSRASMSSSSRPWSPFGSSASHSSSQYNQPPPFSLSTAPSASSSRFTPSKPPSRPPSRAQTPSRMSSTGLGVSATPRPRPKTPSHIPAPAGRSVSVGTKADMFSSSASDWSPGSSTRPFSPAFSASGASPGGGGGGAHPPRPPSRSMIPVPSVHLSATTPGRNRAASSMSHLGYGFAGDRSGAESPTNMGLSSMQSTTSPFRTNARRAQTPDGMSMMRSVSAATGGASASGTGSLAMRQPRLPPSSFRDASVTPISRPGSRSGLYDGNGGGSGGLFNASTATLTGPIHEYVAGNSKDPLDLEVARVVNGIPHGLSVERVDPPLKKAPKDGEEVKAQYAFTNALGRKVVTCRLTTLTRATKVKPEGAEKETVSMVTTKKVMCRVGGGWQDLNLYILNRQAGL